MCADFASLDGMGGNIPNASPSTERLGLTVPSDIITGTSMGYQQAGSPNLVIDSVNNRIIVNNSTAKNVLTLGKVTTSQLGLSVKNNSTNTNALFVGQNTDNSLGLSTLDSSGNAILFAGTDSSGNNVVKVAKPGFDAKTASAANLIFNSSQDMFKIVTKLTGNIPGFSYNNSFGRTSITIPHGQSFTPILQIYVQGALVNSSLSLIASSYVPLPISPGGSNITGKYYFSNGSSSYYPLGIAFSVDSTNITIQAETNGSQTGSDTIAAIPYTIFILQETAT